MDSGTLMESEVATVSIAHSQQDMLGELKSDFEFAATVFGSAPQVEKLKCLLQSNLARTLIEWKKTDLRLIIENFKGSVLRRQDGRWFHFFGRAFVPGRWLGESMPKSCGAVSVVRCEENKECSREHEQCHKILGAFQQRCLHGDRGAQARAMPSGIVTDVVKESPWRLPQHYLAT